MGLTEVATGLGIVVAIITISVFLSGIINPNPEDMPNHNTPSPTAVPTPTPSAISTPTSSATPAPTATATATATATPTPPTPKPTPTPSATLTPTPTLPHPPSCCPSILVSPGKKAYYPGDTVHISISLIGTDCCFEVKEPSPVSLIAPTCTTIAQQDLASFFSGSVCPGNQFKVSMSFELPNDALYGYYDVKVVLSAGTCIETANDTFFVDWL
ncbi:MAG: hypothetical protein WBE22_05490 [Halobacteriota archaeon]